MGKTAPVCYKTMLLLSDRRLYMMLKSITQNLLKVFGNEEIMTLVCNLKHSLFYQTCVLQLYLLISSVMEKCLHIMTYEKGTTKGDMNHRHMF